MCIKEKKKEAKQALKETKKILKRMEYYLECGQSQSIEMAWAFFRVFAYHAEHGDLRPEEINLIRLLKANDEKLGSQ